MNHVKTLLAAGLLAATTATPALAQDVSVFFAGGGGASSGDFDLGIKLGDTTFTYEVLAGIDIPITNTGFSLGIDGGWRDFGEFDFSNGITTELDGFTVGGRIGAPIYGDNVRFVLRGGAFFYNSDTDVPGWGVYSQSDITGYVSGGFDIRVTPNLRISTDVQYYAFEGANIISPMLRFGFVI